MTKSRHAPSSVARLCGGYHQRCVMAFKASFVGTQFVGDLIGVGEARAADVLDADTQPKAFAALGDLRTDLFGRRFSEGDGHD